MGDLGVAFDGEPAKTAGDQRKKLVVLALAAALAVVLAVFVVPSLLGGDDTGAATTPTVRKATTRTTAKPKAKAKAKAKAKPTPKATFNGKIAGDPFKPLYVPSGEQPQQATAATGGAAGGTGDTSGTGDTGGTAGSVIPGKGTVVTTPAPAPVPAPVVAPQPQPIVAVTPAPVPAATVLGLVDVANEGQVATVTVLYKGLSYDNMPVGTKFGSAKEFQVVSAVGKCASFLYGDVQIALCEGEQRTLPTA
jgi:hypothetical protein